MSERVGEVILGELVGRRDVAQAAHLMRFFKCGPGEYGEGDRFLGIRVPVTREVVRRHAKEAELADALSLVESPWHEIRLAGFLLMIEIYKRFHKKRDAEGKRIVVECYLESIPHGNNWDLVDVVAPKILGPWLVENQEERRLLDELAARADSLWHQRVAMVTTWTLLSNGIYDDTFRLAEKFLDHEHDLMHKATGWMLREAGKRGAQQRLIEFLDRHAARMPRTMLRYAIEKFAEPERQRYLKMKP